VLFKGVEELVEDIFFGFLATSHIWVHRSVVAAFEVFNVDFSVAVAVKALESHINEGLAAVIHFTYNLSKELIIVDGAGIVPIKKSKYSGHLGGVRGENAVILHGFAKLLNRECL